MEVRISVKDKGEQDRLQGELEGLGVEFIDSAAERDFYPVQSVYLAYSGRMRVSGDDKIRGGEVPYSDGIPASIFEWANLRGEKK